MRGEIWQLIVLINCFSYCCCCVLSTWSSCLCIRNTTTTACLRLSRVSCDPLMSIAVHDLDFRQHCYALSNLVFSAVALDPIHTKDDGRNREEKKIRGAKNQICIACAKIPVYKNLYFLILIFENYCGMDRTRNIFKVFNRQTTELKCKDLYEVHPNQYCYFNAK